MSALPALLVITGVGGMSATSRAAVLAVTCLVVWDVIFRVHGLYRFDRLRHSTIDEIPRLAAAATSGSVLVAAATVVIASRSPGTEELLAGIALSFGLCVVLRGTLRTAWSRLAPRERGLLVGSGDLALAAARRLQVNPEHRLRIEAYLSSRRTHQADVLEQTYGLKPLGESSEIATQTLLSDFDRVIIADELLEGPQIVAALRACKVAGVRTTIVPRDAGMLGTSAALNRLSDLPLLEIGNTGISRWTLGWKRAMDITGAVLALVLLAPLLIAVAVAIRLDSRGPAVFRQQRIGRAGRPFQMIKFRTMTLDAEARLRELVDIDELEEPMFKFQNDPRATRVGRWLRRTSLDELPQLFNVLGGSMSLVGPRPEQAALVARYTEAQRIRLAAKPGMTGPMQVYGRADLTFEERLALENEYIENISLGLDLSLLARTPQAMLRGAGAY